MPQAVEKDGLLLPQSMTSARRVQHMVNHQHHAVARGAVRLQMLSSSNSPEDKGEHSLLSKGSLALRFQGSENPAVFASLFSPLFLVLEGKANLQPT